jgi:hypothetical protein
MSRAAGYAAATDNLRSATRWLLTAAAAAGAAMAAGLQLKGIGSLSFSDWPRLVLAGASLTAALGSVGYMILRTSRLLSDEWIALAHLQLELFDQQLANSGRRQDKRRRAAIQRINGQLSDCQDELYGDVADSITDLYSRLQKANAEVRRPSPSPEQVQAAAELKAAADTLVQAANYSYTRSEFGALRKHLAWAGALFLAGAVVFAFAAHPPKPATTANPPQHAAATSRMIQQPPPLQAGLTITRKQSSS